MALDRKKLEGLRRTVKRHLNWLVREIAGEDALTEEERKDLSGFKPLPKQAHDFIQRSFILGRLKSILKKKEYKEITLSKLDQAIKDAKLTPLEKMALDEARHSAGVYIKGLAADIEAGVFQRLSEAESQLVTEATIRNIVREETAFAVLEQKTWKELASSLSDSLRVEYSKRLEMIARTELHSAKQKGIAQAIANKTDVYGSSDGPDSDVSVVTQTGRCEDCARLYEDKDGNPKIFKLSFLMGNGSNATRNHKKVNKQHVHWVATVPPSHPHCFCELVYVPPGYTWKDRKLVLEDKDKLVKAIGDSALSATRKPKGPPQKGPTPPAQPGNIPGVASPAKTTAPKPVSGVDATVAPGGAKGGAASTGPGIEYEYWKGTGVPSADGNWEAYQKKDGGQGYRRPMGSAPDRPAAKEDPEQQVNPVAEAMQWSKQPHPDIVKMDHISRGKIVDTQTLGEEEKGITESYRVTIEGNGRGLVKPPAFHGSEAYMRGEIITEGAQSVPVGTQHKREAAAYSAHKMFGLDNFVPPTATREFRGVSSSIQSWEEGFEPLDSGFMKGNLSKKVKIAMGDPEVAGRGFKNKLEAAIEICPKDKKEKFIQKLNDGAVMALVLNHNDQHLDNVLINDDFDVRFIDNSVTAANGMEGAKVQILRDFHNMGRKVKISETMMTRFGNTSLGDMQRALGGQLEDWAVGQTFVRMKYLQHLQETEGHIDYEKFRATIGAGSSLSDNIPRAGFWPDYKAEDESSKEFTRRKESGLLQNQLFESFAKQWISDALAQPEDHPDHIAAKQLNDIGIFMGQGFATNPKFYRDKGLHKRYEKSIKPGYPPKDLNASSSVVTKPKEEVNVTAKTEPAKIGTPKTVRLNSKDLIPATRDANPDGTKPGRKVRKSADLFVRLDRR